MTVRRPLDPTPTSDDAELRRERAVLACVCACTVLVIGFVASINLAVPLLSASSLEPSPTQLLWIVDAYVLFFACLVIPAGALGDRFGQRTVLASGLALFAAGAVVSASAPAVAMMLLGRVVTGVGAAAVLPNALAVLVTGTAPQRRPRAIAVWAAMSGAGGVVGNVGGGAVLTSGSWRALFWVVAALALALCAWVLRSGPRGTRSSRPLGLPAASLLTLAVLALLIGIIEGAERGWTDPLVIAAFVAAAAVGAGWALVELHSDTPLLDPRLFRIAELRGACLGMLVVFFGMFALFYVNASLLQYTRGFTVLQAGVAILPLTVPLLLLSRRIPALVDRAGQLAVLAAAFASAAIGLLGLASAVDQPYAVYAAWLVVTGVGVTLALPTLTMTITSAMPVRLAGVAGGLQATTRELGSALGVAVVGSVTASRLGHHLEQLRVDPHRSLGALADVDPSLRGRLSTALESSTSTGLTVASAVVAGLGVLILADLGLARRRIRD